ncbi:GPP34 family phosphoprotein [Kribbella sp. NPDC023972]|uniref:GPP34 family phosphoprotein n=1 Tax=Kribbella sp. NPDC023972 TaxID=3154795 RepID=UPI0033CC65C2
MSRTDASGNHLTVVRGAGGTLPRRPPVRRPRVAALGRVKPPEALTARLFLLAYDPSTGRLTGRWTKLGRILRAAALVDLQLRGNLADVERYRVLGLFPADRITLRHPLVRRHVLRNATDTLRSSRLVTRVDLRDAAVVVLAATGDLRTVLTKDQRTRHRDRLAQLAVRVGPVVPALKKALQQSHTAAAG